MGEQRRILKTQFFGRTVRFAYAENWLGWSLMALRLSIGWILLFAGIDKLREGLRGLQPNWTADGYLAFAIHENNPFASMLAGMASPVVDFLVVWGLTLTGICMILGLATRFAAFWAAVMMLFFHVSHWQGWFKVEHGWLVDELIVYVFLLFALGAFGAGRLLGVDQRIESTAFVQRRPWLRLLLG